MGEEIESQGFSREDEALFAERLARETAHLKSLFARHGLSQDGYVLGFEIETWILDHNYFPAPINAEVLAALDDPLVVPELSRFNVELNCDPLPLRADALSRGLEALRDLWARCNAVAHAHDANLVMIGTLPTIRDADMTLANMSPLNRYYALNREVLRRRSGHALRVEISGRESLVSEHRDVMLEAATTSFQIHLKTPAHVAHRYYNASIAASGPILAACGNAPFLFGKSLWEETRIALFEQAVVVPGPPRVSMGSGYALHSLFDIFDENARIYNPLLPMTFDAPVGEMRHLRLHNGVIWRWNRPLVGFEEDGAPHLRIEHRVLPAGPSLIDMMANAALYIGLARALVEDRTAERMPFSDACANFYTAARDGLEARVVWPELGAIAADRLLLERAIPMAREGLSEFGVDEGGLLDIVEARVRSRQTGAIWQRRAIERREGDLMSMMAAYCEGQRSGAPVHEWAT